MLPKLVVSLLLLSCTALAVPAAEPANSEHDSLHNKRSGNKYIVVLEDSTNVDRLISSLSQTITAGVRHRYSSALKGFSGTFNEPELAAIRALPNLAYVEEDSEVHMHVKETSAPYGLAITSANGKLAPEKQTTYYYKPAKHSATVYVLDTGIDVTHPEFGGRATLVKDFTGEGRFDGNGHGTHVSGTVGSFTYGVFKAAKLVGVKVLDSQGSGTIGGIIAGIDWVTKHHKGPSVINMSLGDDTVVKALNQAVQGAYNSGVLSVVSAGNSGDYGVGACSQSPASAPSAITVGAIDSKYKAAGFSSEDECVDIHGPGVDVLSTWPGNQTMILSGTSMSSPHVAGVAAYLTSQFGLTNPAAVTRTVLKYAQRGLLSNLRGAPNVLANNGFFE